MTARFRPIHSGFETLRQAGSALRQPHAFSGLNGVTNEQLTATGYARIARPADIFSDFVRR
ncbi:hypothetical protein [Pararhizobium sp.]|uniref:hypothetical protein n=1 Tax=Pararhizobium sp. TaxID=1977563 RepID=UPI00271791F8|nr:hypothetical protein [Pararhizobium sp.]MDO9418005.1 hypothetical protein [Pararhizobium sp.]